MRVLIADPIAQEGVDLFTEHGFEVDQKTGLTPEDLLKAVPEYDGLVVRSETRVTREVLKAGRKLQTVGRAGVGVDNIDVDAATEQGVVVVNAPSSNTIAAAEHTVAMILALARHIPQAHASLEEGEWARRRFMGTELRGKVLGIVGLGRIGTEVARRAAGFEVEIVGYDPFVAEEHAQHIGVEIVDFDELLRRSDIVTLHVPKTEGTKHLVGVDEIQQMKPGSFLVNCARGGLVDEDALYQALETGALGGVALDVFSEEPPKNSPLFKHPRVVVTPHLGASTTEAQSSVAREVVEQMLDVLEGRTPRYAVNAPLVPAETIKELAPYIPVSLAAGRLASQLTDGQPARLTIAYRGEVAQFETAILRATVLRGFLERSSEERVNIVNASLTAQRHGLHVEERKSEEETPPYTSLLTVEVKTSAGEASVAATLTRNDVHIVQIDAYHVDIVPSGTPWMIISHTDRPGMIGNIGTITGENDINIASMQVSREKARGPALTVLGLDEPVDDDQIAAIARIPDVHRVRIVHL